MGGARRRALWPRIVASLILLLFAAWAGRQALGSFLQLAPADYIDRVLAGQAPALPAQLALARAQLERARSVDPDNPYVWEYLAQTALIVARQPHADVAAALRDAQDDYRRASALRPNSGYLKAGEMTSLYLLSRQTALTASQSRRMRDAMIAAVRMAPWEKQVLAQVMDVALGERAHLDPGQRAALQEAAQHLILLGGVAR